MTASAPRAWPAGRTASTCHEASTRRVPPARAPAPAACAPPRRRAQPGTDRSISCITLSGCDLEPAKLVVWGRNRTMRKTIDADSTGRRCAMEVEMKQLTLDTPSFAFVVVTRAALAFGVGLLVSAKI